MIKLINELNKNNSSNYKLEVLKKYKTDEIFKKILYYTYNPEWNYFIKKIPNYVNSFQSCTLNDVFNHLDKLRKREVTGNEAITQTTLLLQSLTKDDAYIFELILGRDLKSNISVKSINKVFNNFIPTTPYNRCEKLTEKSIKNIKYPAYIQIKADGSFCYLIKKDNEVTLMTRNGNTTKYNKLDKLFENVPNNTVLIGEALIKEDGIIQNRKTGNGKITSFYKRFDTIDTLLVKYENNISSNNLKKLNDKIDEFNQIEDSIIYQIWDCITIDDFNNCISSKEYSFRLNKTKEMINLINNDKIQLIKTYEIDNINEAKHYAKVWMDDGLEGGILKDKSVLWENKTSKKMIKIKAILSADLKCVNVLEGTGKYENKIGSLVLESACGKLKVNVGSGLTDKERELDKSNFIGNIIEVEYNELIQSKSKDTYSLFLPIFQEVRFDKDTADDLQRLSKD